MITILYIEILHKDEGGNYTYDVSLTKEVDVPCQLRKGDEIYAFGLPFEELDLKFCDKDDNPNFTCGCCPDFNIRIDIKSAAVCIDTGMNHVYLENQDIYFENKADLRFYIKYLVEHDGWELSENNRAI